VSSKDPHAVVRAEDVTAGRLAVDTPRTDAELTPVELGVDVGGGGDLTVIRDRRCVRAAGNGRPTPTNPKTSHHSSSTPSKPPARPR
jgi:hypothetical protein